AGKWTCRPMASWAPYAPYVPVRPPGRPLGGHELPPATTSHRGSGGGCSSLVTTSARCRHRIVTVPVTGVILACRWPGGLYLLYGGEAVEQQGHVAGKRCTS